LNIDVRFHDYRRCCLRAGLSLGSVFTRTPIPAAAVLLLLLLLLLPP
jgi:hypothetical protein